MVADPTVVEVVLLVLADAVALAVVVSRFDAAPFVVAVLGSSALGLLVLADSLILLYVVAVPSNKFPLLAILFVFLPGLDALLAAVLTVIGVLADLIWCFGHRHFGGLGFPLMLATVVVELAGIALISSVEAGAAFVPPLEYNTSLDSNALEAIAVACMTLAALFLCVGAFVTLRKTGTRGAAGTIVLPARGV